ncbi:MAG: hypothetical protein LBU15_01330 [Rickettsiales bacterium]|jgi:hypothetical protein|nr:hypothetical protein [Rickettsiales bacterium]
MGKLLVRVRYFLRCERRKIFSWFFLAIKFVVSFALAISVPVAFFIVFLFQQPREIEVLNRYIDRKMLEINPHWNFSYGRGRVGISGLRLVYAMDNFEIRFGDNLASLPSIGFRMKMGDLIRGRFRIDELTVENLESHIDTDAAPSLRINRKIFFENRRISDLLHSSLEHLRRGKVVFNYITLRNSTIHVSGGGEAASRLELRDGNFHITENHGQVTVAIAVAIKMDGGAGSSQARGSCQLFPDGNVDCRVDLDNFSLANASFHGLLGGDSGVEGILKKINGSFDAKLSLNFSGSMVLESCGFTIYSASGNFNLDQFFGGPIVYRNAHLVGELRGSDYLNLKSLRATLLPERAIDFSMSMELEREKKMGMDINISGASAKDVKILWPVFLNDSGARDWTIEHLTGGSIPRVRAHMNFDHREGRFELMAIDSEVLFRGARLDYHSDFPSFSAIDGRALFTVDTMNIHLDRATMADGTLLGDGLVQLDFNDESSMLNISAKTSGKIYEMMYFLENQDREGVRNVTSKYADGLATLDVSVKIPLARDVIALSDVFIRVAGDVRGNNTSLLKNNSDFGLQVLKEFGSDRFEVEFGLEDSLVAFRAVDFVKPRGQSLNLSLEIEDSDGAGVVLDKILASGETLGFEGKGLLKNGSLSRLEIKNLNLRGNSFDINYRTAEGGRVEVGVKGDSLEFAGKMAGKELGKRLASYLTPSKSANADFALDSATYRLFIGNSMVGGYSLKNLSLEAVVENGVIERLWVRTPREDGNTAFLSLARVEESKSSDRYSIVVECPNFGKFLSEINLTDNLIYGDLHLEASLDRNNVLRGNLELKNGFHYLFEGMESKNSKLFSYIMNSEDVPGSLKNTLKSQNTVGFEKLRADFELNANVLRVSNLALGVNYVLGLGASGGGTMDIESGKIRFSGMIIPLEKINTVFGISKVPILGDVLFGNRGGGLIAMDYEFTKEGYGSSYDLRIVPSNVTNPLSLGNFIFIFLLL